MIYPLGKETYHNTIEYNIIAYKSYIIIYILNNHRALLKSELFSTHIKGTISWHLWKAISTTMDMWYTQLEWASPPWQKSQVFDQVIFCQQCVGTQSDNKEERKSGWVLDIRISSELSVQVLNCTQPWSHHTTSTHGTSAARGPWRWSAASNTSSSSCTGPQGSCTKIQSIPKAWSFGQDRHDHAVGSAKAPGSENKRRDPSNESK